MMKINFITFLILILSNNIYAQEMILDEKNSSLKWTGKEITTKTHFGSLRFKEGILNLKNDVLSSGKFVVDMTTIDCEDLSGSSKTNLESHLKSDDFFSVNKYPEAILTIEKSKKKANGMFTATGKILIKGISQNITFDIYLNDKNGNAKLTFDRSKHDVSFRSGSFFQNLGDKLIYDDIEIEAQLNFN